MNARTLRQVSTAPARRPRHPHEINWIIKASKLCNLRCRYCYEWNELDRVDRIQISQWTRLLEAVRDYHLELQRSGRAVRSNLIWHGGEPLLLPRAYFEEVFSRQRDILGSADVDYCNVLQSNLYSVPDAILDVLEREGVQLGASFDLVPGVRLTAGGEETEAVVAGNIDRLQKRGVRLGAVVVLAGHTSRHVRQIYDFYAARNIPVRFLPLFDAPLNTPDADFAMTSRGTVAALKRLFDYWIRCRHRTAVWPLIDYVYVALLRKTGESRQTYDRGRIGEWALLVNTDGTLYHRPDAYNPSLAIGNVFDHTIGEILQSAAYDDSIQRDRRLAARFCERCEYLGACNTLPIFESPRREIGRHRCGIAYPLYRYVERYLNEHRFTITQIQQILLEI